MSYRACILALAAAGLLLACSDDPTAANAAPTPDPGEEAGSCSCDIRSNGARQTLACGSKGCVGGVSYVCGDGASLSKSGEACSDDDDDIAPGKDGGSSTNPESTTPSAISITGKLSPTCSSDPVVVGLYKCKMTLSGLTMTPAPPTGKSVADTVSFLSENLANPNTGWTSGLVVSKPAYPSACMMSLNGFSGGGTTFLFSVTAKTEPSKGGGNCGLITAQHGDVTPADFNAGFSAKLDATWKPTGKLVPTTITLTR